MSKRKRLTREDWLTKALDVLVRKGSAEISVSRLANNLGVTKGSFYWHFKSRKDFVRNPFNYWQLAFTMNVVANIDAMTGSAEERLYALMEFLRVSNSAKHDVAIRAWAAREPELDALVREVDRQRLSYVRALFAEMGFQEDELEMRTLTFVVYHSLEESFLLHLKLTNEERAELLITKACIFHPPLENVKIACCFCATVYCKLLPWMVI